MPYYKRAERKIARYQEKHEGSPVPGRKLERSAKSYARATARTEKKSARTTRRTTKKYARKLLRGKTGSGGGGSVPGGEGSAVIVG